MSAEEQSLDGYAASAMLPLPSTEQHRIANFCLDLTVRLTITWTYATLGLWT